MNCDKTDNLCPTNINAAQTGRLRVAAGRINRAADRCVSHDKEYNQEGNEQDKRWVRDPIDFSDTKQISNPIRNKNSTATEGVKPIGVLVCNGETPTDHSRQAIERIQ